ncbi:hypothetical protein AMTR_s00068p00075750 [Amborella trichopoda]|uniref:Uncharacterized protein n=1 Tax=Amborella trichopoda TaxID=13333 RepID=U5DCY1_AMBTC|nr:hypothetical protein AMTR_s00068p00075750 [Amborella trichopoda]
MEEAAADLCVRRATNNKMTAAIDKGDGGSPFLPTAATEEREERERGVLLHLTNKHRGERKSILH